ncbi:hypothetical protein [Streptomyces sp. NPDC003393]
MHQTTPSAPMAAHRARRLRAVDPTAIVHGSPDTYAGPARDLRADQ